jgi:excisionase family DNA binding protein
MAALPMFISTTEAAHQLGVSEARLRHMIETGTIKAANIGEEIVVSEASIRGFIPKDQLPEYKKYTHLKGVPIWLSEAARKYDITLSVVHRWVERGYITRLGQDKNKIILNEQDVAYCSEIYHANKGQGKWLFNADGTPYVPRSEKAQAPA